MIGRFFVASFAESPPFSGQAIFGDGQALVLTIEPGQRYLADNGRRWRVLRQIDCGQDVIAHLLLIAEDDDTCRKTISSDALQDRRLFRLYDTEFPDRPRNVAFFRQGAAASVRFFVFEGDNRTIYNGVSGR